MVTRFKQPVRVYLRQEQIHSPRALALQRHVSMAELINESVDRLLGDPSFAENPLWDIIGIGDSGLGDLAEKHAEYLAGWHQAPRP